MTKKAIISQVKEIILKYSNPTRIWVFGSQVNGESTPTSDIDIAYDDKNSKNDYLIVEEVNKIDTLNKIDVKNIAKTEDRFKNRVIATGKVIYSANKKLRAEDSFYNFSNALNKFIEAINEEAILKEEGFYDIFLDLIIKRFEFTYEMSWKAIKRYLDFVGIDAKTPRSAFKEAYAISLITNENIWLDMINQRNLSSHIYDEWEISDILYKIDEYKQAFLELKENLEKELN